MGNWKISSFCLSLLYVYYIHNVKNEMIFFSKKGNNTLSSIEKSIKWEEGREPFVDTLLPTMKISFILQFSIELRTMSAIYYILIFPCFFLVILNWFARYFCEWIWLVFFFWVPVPSRKLGLLPKWVIF